MKEKEKAENANHLKKKKTEIYILRVEHSLFKPWTSQNEEILIPQQK